MQTNYTSTLSQAIEQWDAQILKPIEPWEEFKEIAEHYVRLEEEVPQEALKEQMANFLGEEAVALIETVEGWNL